MRAESGPLPAVDHVLLDEGEELAELTSRKYHALVLQAPYSDFLNQEKGSLSLDLFEKRKEEIWHETKKWKEFVFTPMQT